MGIITWFKKLFYIIKYYDIEHETIKNRLYELYIETQRATKKSQEAVRIIRERTEVSADLHLTGSDRNQVIVVGRYRNRDFVQVYTLTNNDCENIINILRDMQKYGIVEKIDAPYGFKQILERDLFI